MKRDKEITNVIYLDTDNKSFMGKIVRFDEKNNKIFVGFKDNPVNQPLQARIACRTSLKDIKYAIENELDAKIFFEDGDKTKPVVEFIDFSLFDDEKEENCDIHIKGNKIIFEAETELILKSGDAKAILTAKNGKFAIKGENIESSANLNNQITGASVTLN